MFLSDIDRDDLDMDINTSTAAELQAVDHDMHSESNQSTTGNVGLYHTN